VRSFSNEFTRLALQFLRSLGEPAFTWALWGWHGSFYSLVMPSPPASPRLLDQVRSAMRLRHYSPRTEEAYLSWIRLYHGKRHPKELGADDVTAFLSSLAGWGVSASTQNQALGGVLFLYEVVLSQRLGGRNERGDGPS
jgi:hypothetical protein